MISQDTIALVRDRSDIVAIVSASVPSLKKHGRRFTGLCPFHKEKTPSFSVNPDTGLYYCFGCKEGGDVYKFVERTEGYSFVEAVRALAERAGIPIEEERSAAPSDADRHKREREEMVSAMAVAAEWYEAQLREHEERKYATDELARRGLKPGDQAVQAFRVGYAPPAWDGLAGHLKKKGVSPELAARVGLVVPRSSGSGYYDRFRHRLMFAVADAQGRVIAFSGRALLPLPSLPGDDAHRDPPPKYINSPESPIYVKGANLFGLWQARDEIRQGAHAVIVEGNFDVVSLHARGFGNVVAPLGTAFTIDQAKLLRRYATRVTLLFDGDAAGRKATAVARDPCKGAGLEARVGTLPDKVDPDEFVRTKGPDALRDLCARAFPLLEWLIDAQLDTAFHAADARERSARVERVARLLAEEDDPMVRSLAKAYADRLAGRLDLVGSSPEPFRALERAVRRALPAPNVPARAVRPSEARVAPRTPGKEERKAIVGAILEYPALVDEEVVARELELLSGESARIVAVARQCVRTKDSGQKVLDATVFLAQMPPVIHSFASARLAAPAHESIDEARASLLGNANKLRSMQQSREVREIAREQEKSVGDWDAETQRAREALELARDKHGIGRAERVKALEQKHRGKDGDEES